MSALRFLIIDDDKHEREGFISAINDSKLARAEAASPPRDLDVRGLLLAHRPDAVLIDYQLNEKGGEASRVSYRGPSLAAAIRENVEDLPLILVTRPAILNGSSLHTSRSLILTAFDEIVVKDHIRSKTESFCRDMQVLVKGFRALAKTSPRTWEKLMKLLVASKEQSELLRRADPPVGLLSEPPWNASSNTPTSRKTGAHSAKVGASAKTRWSVSDVAQWLRNVVIEYPGILYSSSYAAAQLGLTVEAFQDPAVQHFFRNSSYRGIFAPEEGRWWGDLLLLRARNLLSRNGLEDQPIAAFADAWKRAGRGTLAQARCNTSGRTPADSICYVLHQPVLREQSLPYRPDSRPACMDEARVSFKAIRETDRYDERLFPPDARRLLNDIQKAPA